MNESSAFRGSVKTAVTRAGASSSRASATGSDRVGSACADAFEGVKKTGGDQQEQDRGQRGPDSGPMHSRHRRLLPSGAPDGE